MNDLIYTNYQTGRYSAFMKARSAKQAGTVMGGFMDMAIQTTGKSRANTLTAALDSTGGLAAMPAQWMVDLSVKSAGQPKSTETTGSLSLEQMLKAKYPGITYHVFDASSSDWRTRNDYPHYLLYQQDIDTQALENWKPTGENPFYGSVDGRFIAPKEIKALSSIRPGSKAVVIHPKVQARMEQDPGYAHEIMERIDAWFAFDVARNESIRPGSTIGMSQAVAIGEDGSIVNAQSCSSGGEITQSSDEMVQAYYRRKAKQADLMRWLAKEQRQDKIREDVLDNAAAAKTQLKKMLDDGKLQEIFGEKISGVPTQTVLAMTRSQVWGI